MTQKISVDQLKAGMVIIKVTAQNGPVKIKKSGLVSSSDMVKALAEMGVQEVEIDPDMTVEVKKPKIAKSKTQQLVEDTSTVTQNIDQGISEQFNRSLFLPSVQELPEAWQYYGKKSLIASVVVAGGFCVGLVLANLTTVTQLIHQSTDTVQTAAPLPNSSITEDELEEQQDSQVTEKQTNIEPSDMVDVKPEQPIIEQPKTPPSNQKQDSNENVSVDETAQLLAEQQAEQEQTNADEQNNIPPELLQRFRNALASIGDETPVDPTDDAQPIRDVPAVNELPAWVLTELPSMAFSAHMYVSAPEERWVRVNGKRVVEGQEIEDGLVLIGIEPQHVIMTFKGQEFSMDALSDW
ncbi:general secretion pathway protein GspB [Aliiglaciecola sp. NS0011-25]|uniref:general secretion pathway protein GspB n=1 Tax=Aliiglaciecola sp. NS0011-25 TaxID=3127654 RepID=UPI003107EA94